MDRSYLQGCSNTTGWTNDRWMDGWKGEGREGESKEGKGKVR